MDRFLLYLLVINLVTFLAFTIDFFLCLKFPALDDTKANALVLDAFPILGGATGMLLALFLLGGLGRGHRVNKDNIAWWFLALICLVVWALVILAKYGIVALDPNASGLFSGWKPARLRVLGIYCLVINIVTFVAFAHDKRVAAEGNDYKRRAPEARLLGLCFVGGSIGGLLAMRIVRHKTRKWYFVWGLPLFVVLDVVTILYAHMAGII